MRVIFRLAWERFTIITAIIGDVQGRTIALAFYFTILMPFGLRARLLGDDLLRRSDSARWLDRPLVDHDLDSARRQG